MIDRIRRTAERFSLFAEGDSIVAALSGGADSVSLLHALNSLKEEYNLTLYAAHLNHCLRGQEAERDESFCKILCEKYNIPIYIRRSPVPELARQRRVSEELCGRQERYAFFEELGEKLGAKIATAHTSSDNAETLLFNIARGASVSGASGIPPKRGNIIRPLIELSRADIEEYCRENALEYVTDSTNLGDMYTRNRIRHAVIPKLRELNPSFEEAVLRFTQSAAEASDYLDIQAESLLEASRGEYGFDSKKLLASHPAVLKTAVSLLCKEHGATPESRHISLIIRAMEEGGAVELNKSLTVFCAQGLLRIAGTDENSVLPFRLELRGKAVFSYLGREYEASAEIPASVSAPVFRTIESGDSFTFPSRGITKPLRKAYNKKKIPAERRKSILLLADGGTVLWCEPFGFSKQGEEYKNNYKLTVREVPK